MTRSRTRPSAEGVLEAIRVLSGTIEHANSYLEMIADTLDTVRTEIGWLIDNREDVFGHLKSDGKGEQPNSPNALLRQLLESAELSQDDIEPETRDLIERAHCLLKPSSLSCDACETEVSLSVDTALTQGWAEVYLHDGKVYGHCPDCLRKEDESVEVRPVEPNEPLLKEPTLEEKQADHKQWCECVRDAAQKSSEGLRRLEVPGAVAEYEIAPLPNGKWAVSIHLEYKGGDSSGFGCPWIEQETREACVSYFLERARKHFAAKKEFSQGVAQRGMAKLLAGEGLFGFVEPEPVKQ